MSGQIVHVLGEVASYLREIGKAIEGPAFEGIGERVARVEQGLGEQLACLEVIKDSLESIDKHLVELVDRPPKV